MVIWLKRSKYYILAFLIIEFGAIALLYNSSVKKEDNYFLKKISELQIAYSAIVNSYSLVSQAVFNEIIDKPEVIDIFTDAYTADEAQQAEIREKMYQMLLPTYRNLKRTNFVQLHFQFPDCSSFLRFHKPERFGDDLSGSRYSVKIANTEKIKVQGFEIGKVYHGYRYIYPLFNKDMHIGSIEIGVPFNVIQEEMEKIFTGQFYFIMRKDIVEKNIFQDELINFINSSISDDYLIEKVSDKYDNSEKTDNIEISEGDKINSIIREKVFKKLQNNNPFAVFTEMEDENFIITFIPIHNLGQVKIGYIISYVRDSTLKEYRKNLYVKILGVSLLFLAIICFIYYINYSKSIIKQSRDYLQSITDNITEGLLVLDTNNRVISVNPAAEKILGLYCHEIKGRDLDNILNYKDKQGDTISSDKWPIFDNVNFGLTYKAEDGFFIIKNQKEIPLELSAAPRYQNADLTGFLIVFEVALL
jgi:two-component system sensor histidine kinase/response regulator